MVVQLGLVDKALVWDSEDVNSIPVSDTDVLGDVGPVTSLLCFPFVELDDFFRLQTLQVRLCVFTVPCTTEP